MISDLLNKSKMSISFEVSPPKTEDEFKAVFAKLDSMAKLNPDFISSRRSGIKRHPDIHWGNEVPRSASPVPWRQDFPPSVQYRPRLP